MASASAVELPHGLWANLWEHLDTLGFLFVLSALLGVGLLEFFQQLAQRKRNAQLDVSLPEIALEQLKAFDGIQLPMTYCSVRGRVYDVSSSANFLPGATYHFLAGADATVGLAKMSRDQSLVNSMQFEDLTEYEWRAVAAWVDHMNAKYTCVGMLKEYQDFAKTKEKT